MKLDRLSGEMEITVSLPASWESRSGRRTGPALPIRSAGPPQDFSRRLIILPALTWLARTHAADGRAAPRCHETISLAGSLALPTSARRPPGGEHGSYSRS